MKSNEEIDIKAIEMSLIHFENIFLKIVERQAVGAHFVASVLLISGSWLKQRGALTLSPRTKFAI